MSVFAGINETTATNPSVGSSVDSRSSASRLTPVNMGWIELLLAHDFLRGCTVEVLMIALYTTVPNLRTSRAHLYTPCLIPCFCQKAPTGSILLHEDAGGVPEDVADILKNILKEVQRDKPKKQRSISQFGANVRRTFRQTSQWVHHESSSSTR